MTVIIDDGWLWLNDGSDDIRVAFETAKLDKVFNPTARHYPGPAHMSYSLKKWWWMVKIQNVIFDTYTKRRDFIRYLDDFQEDGPFELELIRNSSLDKEEFYSGDTDLDVMCRNLRDLEKIEPGDGEHYIIGFLLFEEGG